MTKKILLVDDEDDIRKVVTFRLKKAGYEVLAAVNGKEGVEAVKKYLPDLVIMDYRMPVMDGVEASKRITQDSATKHIPVLFMTASSANMTLEMITGSGAVDFINKPFEADQLMEKIRSVLGEKA